MRPDRTQNSLSTVSLVLGIVSIPLVFCYALGIPAAIAALVLGVLGIRRSRRGQGGRGQAIAGLICAAVALAVAVLLIARPDS